MFKGFKHYKPPKHPSTEKWKNQLWCIHIVENYSALKNERFRIIVSKPWPVLPVS